MKTLIFDYGGVLVDWNPHYMLDKYFGSVEKAEWFIQNICNSEWNNETDAGKPYDQAVAELSARYPEWKEAIEAYRDHWIDMMNGEVPGMYDLLKELKDNGYRILGLTNFSSETFSQIRYTYRIFSLIEGMVVSAEEFLIKPDPELYRVLIRRFGLDVRECIFIDDKLPNVLAAEALGIKGIQFKGPEALRKSLNAEGITVRL
ncbi:MAG: HAD family phosphatase [Bacteroidales bacterium]|jgi:2-haloacid dehalogenase|nr:HAD family phosphatase [Bacteroidales bacterium]